MIEPTSVEAQYERAAGDDLRTLVVGAGIAGITVAQLLRAAGRHPILVERSSDGGHEGYMLALMPMVDAALDDLAVHEPYRAASTPLTRYAVRDHKGRPLREDSMTGILARFGDYRGIGRGELVDVLTAHGCPVALDTTVSGLTESADGVRATVVTDGRESALDVDLVIVADGLHSTTRAAVVGDRPVQAVDTGWGGWVVWIAADGAMDLAEEIWGDGFFLGTYPVADRIGVFLGGADTETAAGPAAFVERVRAGLRTVGPRHERALAAVAAATDPYYWPMTDRRSPAWTRGRVVLLGDAAAGFMPTAGIGAGMAMESAWVLARLLRRTSRESVEVALRAYERAQRPRIEAAQDNSRALARMMFRRGRLLAVARELAVRLVSVRMALRPIRRLLESRPDPDSIPA